MNNEYTALNLGCSSEETNTSSSTIENETKRLPSHVINLKESKTHLFYVIQSDNESKDKAQHLVQIKISKERPSSRKFVSKRMLFHFDSDRNQGKAKRTHKLGVASIHKRTDHPSFLVLPEAFSRRNGNIGQTIERNHSTSENSNETYVIQSKDENEILGSKRKVPPQLGSLWERNVQNVNADSLHGVHGSIAKPNLGDYCKCDKSVTDISNRELLNLNKNKSETGVSTKSTAQAYLKKDDLFNISFVKPTEKDMPQRLRAGQDCDRRYKSCYMCPNIKRIFPPTSSNRGATFHSNNSNCDSDSNFKNRSGYVKVNFKLIRQCLIYGSHKEKFAVLDAIRLRMRSPDPNLAINTIEDVVKFDLFGVQCECRSPPLLEELFWPITASHQLQTSIAKFVNALVSYKFGRDYFKNRSMVRMLIWGEYGRDNIEPIMGDNLIGIMMKLSYNRFHRNDMIKNDLFRWLLRHMEEEEYSASKYHLQCMAGLLRNLMRGYNLENLSTTEMRRLIVLLGRYLETEDVTAKRYICDSLLILFQNMNSVAIAKELNFQRVVQEHVTMAANQKDREHLRAVYQLLDRSAASKSFSNQKFDSQPEAEPFLDTDLEPLSNEEVDFYSGECLLREKFSADAEVQSQEKKANQFDPIAADDTRKDGKLITRVFVEHLNCFLPDIEKNRIFPLCNTRCADKIKTCSHVGDIQPIKRKPYIPPNSRTSGLARQKQRVDDSAEGMLDEDSKHSKKRTESIDRLTTKISTISHDRSAAKWDHFDKGNSDDSMNFTFLSHSMKQIYEKHTNDAIEGIDVLDAQNSKFEVIIASESYHEDSSEAVDMFNESRKYDKARIETIAANQRLDEKSEKQSPVNENLGREKGDKINIKNRKPLTKSEENIRRNKGGRDSSSTRSSDPLAAKGTQISSEISKNKDLITRDGSQVLTFGSSTQQKTTSKTNEQSKKHDEFSMATKKGAEAATERNDMLTAAGTFRKELSDSEFLHSSREGQKLPITGTLERGIEARGETKNERPLTKSADDFRCKQAKRDSLSSRSADALTVEDRKILENEDFNGSYSPVSGKKTLFKGSGIKDFPAERDSKLDKANKIKRGGHQLSGSGSIKKTNPIARRFSANSIEQRPITGIERRNEGDNEKGLELHAKSEAALTNLERQQAKSPKTEATKTTQKNAIDKEIGPQLHASPKDMVNKKADANHQPTLKPEALHDKTLPGGIAKDCLVSEAKTNYELKAKKVTKTDVNLMNPQQESETNKTDDGERETGNRLKVRSEENVKQRIFDGEETGLKLHPRSKEIDDKTKGAKTVLQSSQASPPNTISEQGLTSDGNNKIEKSVSDVTTHRLRVRSAEMLHKSEKIGTAVEAPQDSDVNKIIDKDLQLSPKLAPRSVEPVAPTKKLKVRSNPKTGESNKVPLDTRSKEVLNVISEKGNPLSEPKATHRLHARSNEVLDHSADPLGGKDTNTGHTKTQPTTETMQKNETETDQIGQKQDARSKEINQEISSTLESMGSKYQLLKSNSHEMLDLTKNQKYLSGETENDIRISEKLPVRSNKLVNAKQSSRAQSATELEALRLSRDRLRNTDIDSEHSSQSSVNKSNDCVDCKESGYVLRARPSEPCDRCKVSLSKYPNFVDALNHEAHQRRDVTHTKEEWIKVTWENKSDEKLNTTENRKKPTKEQFGESKIAENSSETKKEANNAKGNTSSTSDVPKTTKKSANETNENIILTKDPVEEGKYHSEGEAAIVENRAYSPIVFQKRFDHQEKRQTVNISGRLMRDEMSGPRTEENQIIESTISSESKPGNSSQKSTIKITNVVESQPGDVLDAIASSANMSTVNNDFGFSPSVARENEAEGSNGNNVRDENIICKTRGRGVHFEKKQLPLACNIYTSKKIKVESKKRDNQVLIPELENNQNLPVCSKEIDAHIPNPEDEAISSFVVSSTINKFSEQTDEKDELISVKSHEHSISASKTDDRKSATLETSRKEIGEQLLVETTKIKETNQHSANLLQESTKPTNLLGTTNERISIGSAESNPDMSIDIPPLISQAKRSDCISPKTIETPETSETFNSIVTLDDGHICTVIRDPQLSMDSGTVTVDVILVPRSTEFINVNSGASRIKTNDGISHIRRTNEIEEGSENMMSHSEKTDHSDKVDRVEMIALKKEVPASAVKSTETVQFINSPDTARVNVSGRESKEEILIVKQITDNQMTQKFPSDADDVDNENQIALKKQLPAQRSFEIVRDNNGISQDNQSLLGLKNGDRNVVAAKTAESLLAARTTKNSIILVPQERQNLLSESVKPTSRQQSPEVTQNPVLTATPSEAVVSQDNQNRLDEPVKNEKPNRDAGITRELVLHPISIENFREEISIPQDIRRPSSVLPKKHTESEEKNIKLAVVALPILDPLLVPCSSNFSCGQIAERTLLLKEKLMDAPKSNLLPIRSNQMVHERCPIGEFKQDGSNVALNELVQTVAGQRSDKEFTVNSVKETMINKTSTGRHTGKVDIFYGTRIPLLGDENKGKGSEKVRIVNSSCCRQLLNNDELINRLSEKVLAKLFTKIHNCGPKCNSPCGGLNSYLKSDPDS